jgi:hypothetical protein
VSSLFSDSARRAALPATPFWSVFKSRAVALLKALYDRHTARPIADDACWWVHPRAERSYVPAELALASDPGVHGGAFGCTVGSKGRAWFFRRCTRSPLFLFASLLRVQDADIECHWNVCFVRPPRPASLWLRRLPARESRLIDVGADDALTEKILQSLPFCVSFKLRAGMYYKARDAVKASHQEGKRAVRITVHRARLFEVRVPPTPPPPSVHRDILLPASCLLGRTRATPAPLAVHRATLCASVLRDGLSATACLLRGNACGSGFFSRGRVTLRHSASV